MTPSTPSALVEKNPYFQVWSDLDELPPDAGRYKDEPDIECGVLCIQEELA